MRDQSYLKIISLITIVLFFWSSIAIGMPAREDTLRLPLGTWKKRWSKTAESGLAGEAAPSSLTGAQVISDGLPVIPIGREPSLYDPHLSQEGLRPLYEKIAWARKNAPHWFRIKDIYAVEDQKHGMDSAEAITFNIVLENDDVIVHDAPVMGGVSKGEGEPGTHSTVKEAIEFFNNNVRKRLIGLNISRPDDVSKKIIELDEEFRSHAKDKDKPRFSYIGGELSVGISMVSTIALAEMLHVPVEVLINYRTNEFSLKSGLSKEFTPIAIPVDFFVLWEGGKHGVAKSLPELVKEGIIKDTSRFPKRFMDEELIKSGDKSVLLAMVPPQELQAMVLTADWEQARKIGIKLTKAYRKLLEKNGIKTRYGAESGSTTDQIRTADNRLITLELVWDILDQAIDSLPKDEAIYVREALDIASSEMYIPEIGMYYIGPQAAGNDDGLVNNEEYTQYKLQLFQKHKRALSCEDWADENEIKHWESQKLIMDRMIGMGDDFNVSHPEKIRKYTEAGLQNAHLQKPNQSGDEGVAIDAVATSHSLGNVVVTSHRGTRASHEKYTAWAALGMGTFGAKFTLWGPGRGALIVPFNIADALYNRGPFKNVHVAYQGALVLDPNGPYKDYDWAKRYREEVAVASSIEGLKEAFEKAREGVPDPKDYWLRPVVACDDQGKPLGNIEDGDTVIHFDFRPDRSLPLMRILADPAFNKFPTRKLDIDYIPFAPYDAALCKELGIEPAFSSDYLYEDVPITAADIWEENAKVVAYVAETEKFTHVTFFFWNRKDKKLKYGYTVMVPSNKVDDHSQMPEMKSKEISDIVLNCIYGRNGMKKADVVVCNFANMDILKHTGNHEAMVRGAEAVDVNVGRILKGVDENNGFALITADHGAGEETKELNENGNFILDPKTGEPIPAVQHSYGSKSPLILYGFGKKENAPFTLTEGGSIANVVPTMLHLQGIKKPEGTAESLIIEKGGIERKHGPAVLIIRDGWGIRKYDTPDARRYDATLEADTPVNDMLMAEYPNTALVSHGKAVGLPEHQMGDSDTCHQQIGAMRTVAQPLKKIEDAIQSGDFFKNERLIKSIRLANETGKAVVLVGMASEGGVHSHINSLFALLELCKREGVKKIKIHVIHDYRDVSLLKTADYYDNMIRDKIRELGLEGRVIIGSEQGRGLIKDRDALNKMQAANREFLAYLKTCVVYDNFYPAIYDTPIKQLLERLKKNEITDREFTRQLEVLSLDDLLKIVGAIRSSGSIELSKGSKAIHEITGISAQGIDRIEENLQLSDSYGKKG